VLVYTIVGYPVSLGYSHLPVTVEYEGLTRQI
jgi:hypothetical protein